REKRFRTYTTEYDVLWNDIISYESCEVMLCEDDKSWPIDEPLPENFEPINPASMLFIFLLPAEDEFFQIWAYFSKEDTARVRDIVERYLGRPQLPRLAHHATAAAVRYILDRSTIIHSFDAKWHDWLRKGPNKKPRGGKWRERGPTYIFAQEGMAIDFYGAGSQLEQMSSFWPWRYIEEIYLDGDFICYQWYDEIYTFRQQVFDEKARREILEAAQDTLGIYEEKTEVEQFLLIRPWSFPSRFHRTWDKLEPFASKASRNGFPPIYDFEEE
ncbi:MAG: hypothetical protein ACQET3_04675, partial [Promethearchaeati archaeon]